MATLSSKWAAPISLMWVSADGYAKAKAGGVPRYETTRWYVGSGGATLHLKWSSRYKYFQIQARVRKRWSPAKVLAAHADASSYDYWDEAGDWQDMGGGSVSADSAAATTVGGGTYRFMATGMEFGYDISEYDLLEYTFRVRALNPPDNTCSEWHTQTLTVAYVPTVTLESCERTPSGARAVFSTNWARGVTIRAWGNFYTPGPDGVLRSTGPRAVQASSSPFDSSGGKTVALDIPERLRDSASNAVNVDQLRVLTGDGADDSSAFSAYRGHVSAALSPGGKVWDVMAYILPCGAHVDPDEVPEPSVTATPGAASLAISVASSGTAYTGVSCHVSWADPLGNPHAEDVEMEEDSGTWSGALLAPPFDTPVDVGVACSTSAGFRVSHQEVTAPSGGRVSWVSDDGGEVSIKLDPEFSSTYEPERETVKPAGRSTPVSRHGTGGKRKLKVSGSTSADDGWKAASEALRGPCDWWLRLPGGERYRVTVGSVGSSTGYRDGNSIESIDVTMTEVG